MTLSEHPITSLSPAAQAVLDATDYPEDWATRVRIAAALRAAADQVAPNDPQEAMHFTTEAIRVNKQGIRCQILAIAAELEQLP